MLEPNENCLKILTFLAFFLIFSFVLPEKVFGAASDNWTWVERNTGMSGLSTEDLVIDPNDDDTLYVLTSSFGVYKSTDAGANWSAVNTGLPSDKVGTELEIDPNDSDTLFVVITAENKIYKTTDAGANWSLSHTGIRDFNTNNGIDYLKVDPTDSDIVYAGTLASNEDGGVWKSTDGGVNWTNVASRDSGSGCDNDVGPFAVDPNNNQKIYAGSVYYGVYISTDGGSNWSTDSQTTDTIYEIVIDSSNSNHVYAAGESGLYTSTDGGSNWSLSSDLSGSVHDLVQSSSDNDVFYAGVLSGITSEVYKSTDGGSNWTDLNLASTLNAATSEIVVDSSDEDIIYFATQNGVYKSTDGGSSASATNTGLPSIPATVREIDVNSENYLFTATSTGLYKSTNGGLNWVVLNSDCDLNVEFHPTNTDEIYCSSDDKIYKTTDGGENWSTLFDSDAFYIMNFAVDQNDPDIFYTGTFYETDIQKSTDGGQTFTTKANPGGFNVIYDVDIDPTDSSKVYVPVSGDYFYRSTDFGDNWSKVTSGLASGLEQLTIDPNNTNTLYCSASSPTLYKSTDYGASWTSINTGITGGGPYLRNVVVDRTDSNTLYVSENRSLTTYKSTDGGDSWTALTTDGLPSTPWAYYLIQDPTDATRLVLGTQSSGGIYTYENNIPVFSTSAVMVADDNGGSLIPGETLTYTVTVTNSGWGDGNDINLNVSLPGDLSYITDSTTLDGTVVSPDPVSSSILDVSLGDLSYNDSVRVTFQATVNDGTPNGTVIGVYGTITSDEDTAGTDTDTVNVTVLETTTSSGSGCSLPPPFSPTSLRGVPGESSDQVILYWEKPSFGEMTHYSLAYGEASGNYLYGAANIGDSTTYTVSGLSTCTDYYFVIAAVNVCASSAFSNEFKVKTNCCNVDGAVETGMSEEEESKKTTGEEKYTVKIKVVDKNSQPLGRVKIILHSEPKEGMTDEDGWVVFEEVEPGEHKVIIADQDFQGEQTVNLEGKVKEFHYTFEVRHSYPWVILLLLIIIFLLSLIIGWLFLHSRREGERN